MKKVYDEIIWYCLGRKNPNHKCKHGKSKEYKNITNVQDWLSILPEGNEYYQKVYVELVNAHLKSTRNK